MSPLHSDGTAQSAQASRRMCLSRQNTVAPMKPPRKPPYATSPPWFTLKMSMKLSNRSRLVST